MLTILEESQGTVVLVESPMLTAENVDEFARHLGDVVQSRTEQVVVVDLRNVSLLSECGLNVLVGAHGRLSKAGGTLRLCSVKGQAQEKLTTTRMDRLLEIYPDVSAALAAESSKEKL